MSGRTDQSTASLKSASSTHDVLDSLMVTSKHLITALEKSDWLDRLLIVAALVFFVLVFKHSEGLLFIDIR